MGICKYCNRDKPLVKSHIIPRSFYELKSFKQKAPKKSLSLISDLEELKPIRRPVGIYDAELFCKDCEDKFKLYDDYGFKLLNESERKRKEWIDEDGFLLGKYYNSYNYKSLKLFFLSILLRSGLSDDFFFQHVELGHHIDILKKAIDTEDPFNQDSYAVFITYYAEIKRGPVFLPPEPQRIKNIKFYCFHLGRLVFHIKVDRREAPLELQPFILKPDNKLYLLEISLKNTPYYNVLKKIVNNPSNQNYFSS